MDSKFIIFVILVNLAPSSFADPESSNVGNTEVSPGLQANDTSAQVTPNSRYGLSQEQSAVFERIINKQQAAIAAELDSIRPVFDYLIESSDTGYNLSVASLIVNGSYGKITGTNDHILDAIPLAVGNACNIPKTIRVATSEILTNIWDSDKSAFEKVATETYAAKRAEVDAASAVTRALIRNYTSVIFDTIRGCVNTTNPNTLAAIETVENEATKNEILRCDAFYDILAGIGSTTNTSLEDYKTQGLNGARDSVENVFALLRAIFLSNQLNLDGVLSTMYTNQHLQIVMTSRYNAGTAVTFTTIRYYLKKISQGLPVTVNDDLPVLNASQKALAVSYKAGSNAFVEAALNIASTAARTPVTTPEYISDFSDSEAAEYYNSIKSALDQEKNYPEARAQTDETQAGLHTGYFDIIHALYDTVRENQSTERNIESGITTREKNVTTLALHYIDLIYEAINILAEVIRAIRASGQEVDSTVEDLLKRADSTIDDMAHGVGEGEVRILQIQQAGGATVQPVTSNNAPNDSSNTDASPDSNVI